MHLLLLELLLCIGLCLSLALEQQPEPCSALMALVPCAFSLEYEVCLSAVSPTNTALCLKTSFNIWRSAVLWASLASPWAHVVLGHGQLAPASGAGIGWADWPCRRPETKPSPQATPSSCWRGVVEVFLLQAAAHLPQAIIPQQQEIPPVPAWWGYGNQELHHSCLQGMGGKVCAHQYTGAELQLLEVEAVVLGTPGHMPEEQHPCHSAALQPCRATGKVGLYLLEGQEGIWVIQP